jgi:hypothetical protein
MLYWKNQNFFANTKEASTGFGISMLVSNQTLHLKAFMTPGGLYCKPFYGRSFWHIVIS